MLLTFNNHLACKVPFCSPCGVWGLCVGFGVSLGSRCGVWGQFGVWGSHYGVRGQYGVWEPQFGVWGPLFWGVGARKVTRGGSGVTFARLAVQARRRRRSCRRWRRRGWCTRWRAPAARGTWPSAPAMSPCGTAAPPARDGTGAAARTTSTTECPSAGSSWMCLWRTLRARAGWWPWTCTTTRLAGRWVSLRCGSSRSITFTGKVTPARGGGALAAGIRGASGKNSRNITKETRRNSELELVLTSYFLYVKKNPQNK